LFRGGDGINTNAALGSTGDDVVKLAVTSMVEPSKMEVVLVTIVAGDVSTGDEGGIHFLSILANMTTADASFCEVSGSLSIQSGYRPMPNAEPFGDRQDKPLPLAG
jgi:hypothetical protein